MQKSQKDPKDFPSLAWTDRDQEASPPGKREEAPDVNQLIEKWRPGAYRTSTPGAPIPSSLPSYYRTAYTPPPAEAPEAPEPAQAIEAPPAPVAKPRFELTLRHKLAAFVWFSLIMIVGMVLLRDQMLKMGDWGYLGAFVINGVSSATIVLPAPGGAVVMLMARDYNLLLLGIASGLGGAVGSLTAYWVGVQSRSALEEKRIYRATSRVFNRAGHLILFIGTSIPFIPMDFASMVAGATRYPIRKYMVYLSMGSIVKMTLSLYGAAASFDLVEKFLRPLF